MKRKQFEEVTKYFINVISKQFEKLDGSHRWLENSKKSFLSRMYLEVIFEDIGICKRYIKGNSVLDFGTGSGYIALLLASLGYSVKGIDIDNLADIENPEINETMKYDQALIWPIFEKKYSNLKFIHYYNNEIPFKDNLFDGVVAYAVLEHIPDNEIPGVMKEIKRVLKPNGYFFVSRLPRKLAYVEYLAKLLGIGHHNRLYGDKEIDNIFKVYDFEIIEKSFTDMLPAFPSSFTNRLFYLLRALDKVLLTTPLKHFAHDIRIMGRKV